MAVLCHYFGGFLLCVILFLPKSVSCETLRRIFKKIWCFTWNIQRKNIFWVHMVYVIWQPFIYKNVRKKASRVRRLQCSLLDQTKILEICCPNEPIGVVNDAHNRSLRNEKIEAIRIDPVACRQNQIDDDDRLQKPQNCTEQAIDRRKELARIRNRCTKCT